MRKTIANSAHPLTCGHLLECLAYFRDGGRPIRARQRVCRWLAPGIDERMNIRAAFPRWLFPRAGDHRLRRHLPVPVTAKTSDDAHDPLSSATNPQVPGFESRRKTGLNVAGRECQQVATYGINRWQRN